MKDERIEQVQQKVRSEIAVIILIGVALSFIVKTFIYNMGLKECMTEYLILIFFPLYQFIRLHTLKVGIYSQRGSKESRNNLVMVSAMLFVTFALSIYGLFQRSPIGDWQGPLTFLALFMVLFLAVYFITNRYNQHKAHKYEMEFDDDR
ncbi:MULTISPECIES: DUF6773 family protein [Desulfitobacterium]|uniref:Uncharacterized protein n=1 Tax=Desulfitobacterium dehalogenans (strain ATCC 51507 / DSM 9161 / JW/IU-DC1) TaxID=756499 RepID=I4A8T5_DESDJ|nr:MULTISPECIES: DUF6773 family protein [Desulfitobacterium]AFM00370.1 hypothetical protein Desde_1983 [Desulfitobacterium dehalogenans ATCC 51507]